MRSIRVETSAATILLTEAPEPKIKDRQTGEIATDTVSGEPLMTLGVVYIEDGESSLIKVTVPQGGVSEGLALGAPVALPGLVARPWESVFNGQQRHGIAFRAAAVTPAAFSVQAGGSEPDVGPDDVAGGGQRCHRCGRRSCLPSGRATGRVLAPVRASRIDRPPGQLVRLCYGRLRADRPVLAAAGPGRTGDHPAGGAAGASAARDHPSDLDRSAAPAAARARPGTRRRRGIG